MFKFLSNQQYRRFAQPLHLGACLVLLSLCVLFLSELLGVRDNGFSRVNASRNMLAETVAMQLSTLASLEDHGAIEYTVSSLVNRNDDITASSLVRANGKLVAQFGDDDALKLFTTVSSLTHLSVPILNNEETWGELRLVFAPVRSLSKEVVGILFFIIASLVAFTLLLNKAFVQLDPNRAVPGRVDTAFNLFASGVLILDEKLQIVMANDAASAMGDFAKTSLLGSQLGSWNWQCSKNWQQPWATTLRTGLLVSDQPVRLIKSDGSSRLIMVSCALVGDGVQGAKGVMVTLDDVSSIERKNNELAATLKELRKSQELINAKNHELERLATYDALTGIYNRRVLMETLAHEFSLAVQNGSSLSCIMTDIDHFKNVNDTYGHSVGDDIIRAVASTLASACDEHDVVGRYGGEEFVMILPGINAAEAADVAERVRLAVMALAHGDRLKISTLSSSFGVADMSGNPADVNAIVECADQALYKAKENGRNRVCIFNVDSESTERTNNLEKTKTALQTQKEHTYYSDAKLTELQNLLSIRDREIKALREFDALTGIPMRTLFLQRVEGELKRALRTGKHVSVMSFELRDLDRLVGTFGHSATDTLVVSVINRLQQGLRESDLITEISAEHTLSRITSNEFGVLLCEVSDAAGTMIVVTRLKRLLTQPFVVGERRVYIGMNIGIALTAHNDISASELFSQASDARTDASTKPDKVSHSFATSMLNNQSYDYIKLESDLRDALRDNKLEVYYQPKFDLKERRIAGMEALIRWQHESRGFVPPMVFVAVAEANGLIEQLSKFVVETTLNQIASWQAEGIDNLVVSVNVSPMQLRADSLVESTLEALESTGVSGKYLEIELTETSVLDNTDNAIAALNILRNTGVSISIDDFGTGYTSLSLLSKLPIDVIKIDRSFIVAMKNSEQDRLIVQSITSMAHTLGFRVVGEGVETHEELEVLAEFGCDLVQGYLISRAMPADAMTVFLKNQHYSTQLRQA